MTPVLLADQSLFLFINHLPHPVFLGQAAQFLSGIGAWGAVWFVIAVLLFIREEERDHSFFLPFIIAGVLAVFTSEYLIKYIIARPRPEAVMGALVLATPGNYSFPSTHATLAWAMAYLLSREEPAGAVIFYVLAILISLSRIYLGVHYPLDIIGGAVLGSIIGYYATYVEARIMSRRPRKQGSYRR